MSVPFIPRRGCAGECWPATFTVQGIGLNASEYRCLLNGSATDTTLWASRATWLDAGAIQCAFGTLDSVPTYQTQTYTVQVLGSDGKALVWQSNGANALLVRDAWTDTDCSQAGVCEGYASGGMGGVNSFIVKGFGFSSADAYSCLFQTTSPAQQAGSPAMWLDELPGGPDDLPGQEGQRAVGLRGIC